jgi:hypothetical protein
MEEQISNSKILSKENSNKKFSDNRIDSESSNEKEKTMEIIEEES